MVVRDSLDSRYFWWLFQHTKHLARYKYSHWYNTRRPVRLSYLIIGIPIVVKWHLYIKTVPCFFSAVLLADKVSFMISIVNYDLPFSLNLVITVPAADVCVFNGAKSSTGTMLMEEFFFSKFLSISILSHLYRPDDVIQNRNIMMTTVVDKLPWLPVSTLAWDRSFSTRWAWQRTLVFLKSYEFEKIQSPSCWPLCSRLGCVQHWRTMKPISISILR